MKNLTKNSASEKGHNIVVKSHQPGVRAKIEKLQRITLTHFM